MKKILCFLLIFSFAAALWGCTSHEAVPENAVAVYYKRSVPVSGSADGVIVATYLDATGHQQDYPYLLSQYFRTTPPEGLASTFPKGMSLVSFKLEGLTAKIVLSDRIADYSGMNLTIALTCLTQTVMSLTGCQEVIISAATMQVNGQNFITLNRDSYLLTDDSVASAG